MKKFSEKNALEKSVQSQKSATEKLPKELEEIK